MLVAGGLGSVSSPKRDFAGVRIYRNLAVQPVSAVRFLMSALTVGSFLF